LNADDYLVDKSSIEKIVAKIHEHQYPTLIYGDCNVLDRDSGDLLYTANIDFSPKNMGRGAIIPHPSLLTKKSYFEKYGLFDINFKIAMDYEWLVRGAAEEMISHAPVLVTNVRNGGVSTFDRSKVIDEMVLALKKNNKIVSIWGEIELRAYFFLRLFIKSVLNIFGLYRLFTFIRDKRAVAVSKTEY